MSKRSDRVMDIVASLIAMLLIAACVVLFRFREGFFELAFGDRSRGLLILTGGTTIGLLIALVVIRRSPNDP